MTPAEALAAMPFAAAIGVEVDAVSPEEVRGGLAWAPERCTAGGILHGGALMALADGLGGICAYLNLPAGTSTATIESKTNFFRAVREGRVTAVARPLHVGRSVIVVETDLHDEPAGTWRASRRRRPSSLPSAARLQAEEHGGRDPGEPAEQAADDDHPDQRRPRVPEDPADLDAVGVRRR